MGESKQGAIQKSGERIMKQNTEDKRKPPFQWNGLTKTDTNALKGLCILVIVLHNFLHVFPTWNIENEFAFDAPKFTYFQDHFFSGLFNDFGLLFSYFGHYGVQMFVFLSAYGLYLSYKNKNIRYPGFVKDRVSKLYPTFFLAVLMVLAINIAAAKSLNQPTLFLDAFLRLSFLSNLIPEKSFALVGPWWFYSMIVQFYLIFPLLRKWYDRYGVMPLILLSLQSCVLQILFNDQLALKGWLINTTVIGHIPVFALGLILAKRKNIPMPAWAFIGCCILFYIGNLTNFAWVFSRIWITVIILYAYLFFKQFIRSGNGYAARAVLFLGNISMYMFAVNGFLRHPFVQLVLRYDNPFIKFACTVAFVLFVICIALILKTAEKYIFGFTSSGGNKRLLFSRKRSVEVESR